MYVGQGTAEKIDFARLYPKSAKSIVICDACRRIHVKSPIRMSLAESVQRYVKASSARYSRADYKREYLRLVGEHVQYQVRCHDLRP